MGRRKVALATGCYYHVFNKSIAGFEIFRSREECARARDLFCFYRTAIAGRSYSFFLRRGGTVDSRDLHGPARVRVIAYCVMPTHFHLFLEQTAKDGISDYMEYAAHSYASYFNTKTGRRGPLWEGRFKNVLVTEDAHALHLARYIHLNPTSAGLVKRPEDWEFSSYHEHLGQTKGETFCDFKHIMNLSPGNIRKFTEDRIDYQRSLQRIKYLLID